MASVVQAAIFNERVDVFRLYDALGLSYQGERTQQTVCPNPAHRDTHPSARLYAETRSVYCWTCQRSWDVVGLVRLRLGGSLEEALVWLQARFGVPTSTIPGAPRPVSLAGVADHVERAVLAARDTLGRARYVRYLTALDLTLARVKDGTLSEADARSALETVYHHAVHADR